MKLTTLLLYLMIITVLIVATNVAQADASPSPQKLRLVVGTYGSDIKVTYSGSFPAPPNATKCEILHITTSGEYGLNPYPIGENCYVSGGNAQIRITLSFNGSYNGLEGLYTPISAITIGFYDMYNNPLTSREYTGFQPITLIPITVSVALDTPPIDTSTIRYGVTPQNPSLNRIIIFSASGDVLLKVSLSDFPSVSTKLKLTYWQTAEAREDVYIQIYTTSSQYQVRLRSLSLITPLNYQLTSVDGYIVIDAGQIDLSSQASGYQSYAIINVMDPVLMWSKEETRITGVLYVMAIEKASLSVEFSVRGYGVNSTYATDTGYYDIIVTGPGTTEPPEDINGEYRITFRAIDGSVVTVSVPFSSTYAYSSGNVLTYVFELIFYFMFVGGALAMILGLLMRLPHLQMGGMLISAASAMVLLVPVIIAQAVRLLASAGFPDPVGASLTSPDNIGKVLDDSLAYIQSAAYYYSAWLRNKALEALAVVVGISVLGSLAGGVLGFATAGAASRIIGEIVGAIGAQLVTFATMAYMGSVLLRTLAAVFPIVITIILIMILVMAILLSLYAPFTGSVAQVFSPVIQLGIVVLMVILLPPIIANLQNMIAEKTYSLTLFGKKILDIPLDFFGYIALTLFLILLIVTAMYIAWNRMLAAFSGTAIGGHVS